MGYLHSRGHAAGTLHQARDANTWPTCILVPCTLDGEAFRCGADTHCLCSGNCLRASRFSFPTGTSLPGAYYCSVSCCAACKCTRASPQDHKLAASVITPTSVGTYAQNQRLHSHCAGFSYAVFRAAALRGACSVVWRCGHTGKCILSVRCYELHACLHPSSSHALTNCLMLKFPWNCFAMFVNR